MTIDSLKTFSANDKILASDTNDNNQYLEGLVTQLNTTLSNTITNQIASVNSSINSLSGQSVKLTGNQTVSGTKTFNGTIKVPATTTTGTALQLAAQSKSSNGYIKLGSGIIIQWGKVTGMGNETDKSITLPTAFTSTNYSVGGSTNCAQYAGDKGCSWYAYSQGTSSFKIQSRFENQSGKTIWWIAVGY